MTYRSHTPLGDWPGASVPWTKWIAASADGLRPAGRKLRFDRLAVVVHRIERLVGFKLRDQLLHHFVQPLRFAGSQVLLFERIVGQVEQLVVRTAGGLPTGSSDRSPSNRHRDSWSSTRCDAARADSASGRWNRGWDQVCRPVACRAGSRRSRGPGEC